MTLREVFRSALALCDDLQHDKKASGRMQMMAVRTERELKDAMLHLQLEKPEILDDQAPETLAWKGVPR